jgi:hypothetical protein
MTEFSTLTLVIFMFSMGKKAQKLDDIKIQLSCSMFSLTRNCCMHKSINVFRYEFEIKWKDCVVRYDVAYSMDTIGI